MIYLAVDSGMRWGELIGLQRKNLGFANRRVRIVDQLVRTADGKFHRTEPKTRASVRSITISRMTAEVLASHLERYAGPGRDGLMFPDTAGNPLTESSFYVHHFKKAQVATGLKLRFQDLRHTSVALAIAGGAHPKAIQARMGHSSIAVTLDRYGHLLPSLDADIADGFDREMQAAKANRDRKVIHANFGDDAVVVRQCGGRSSDDVEAGGADPRFTRARRTDRRMVCRGVRGTAGLRVAPEDRHRRLRRGPVGATFGVAAGHARSGCLCT